MIIPLLLVCLLVLPANLSTSMLIFATAFILMFIGRVNLKYLFGMIGIIVILLGSFIALHYPMTGRAVSEPGKTELKDILAKRDEENYQVNQAKIAIVSGGLVNLRPGKSMQRNFLPHPYSDFIYAIIIEEYGLAGGVDCAGSLSVSAFQGSSAGTKKFKDFPCLSGHRPGGDDQLSRPSLTWLWW